MNEARKGIILAGGTGSRLYPLTTSVSKQLMPVYDKPMIYYPLAALMKCGIQEVLIISTPADLPSFQKLFGDGEQLGMTISYAEQATPDGLPQAFIIGEEFLNQGPTVLALGDNFYYGAYFDERVQAAVSRFKGATVFAHTIAQPELYGVVEFNSLGEPLSLEEKPLKPKSNWAISGMYFYDERVVDYAKALRPSARGELEIIDLTKKYLDSHELYVEKCGRGVAWFDMGNPDALILASQFVQTIQHRQNLKVACIEEIAFMKGWIDKEQLLRLAHRLNKTEYGKYLQAVAESELISGE